MIQRLHYQIIVVDVRSPLPRAAPVGEEVVARLDETRYGDSAVENRYEKIRSLDVM
jgi:hypothetical protein